MGIWEFRHISISNFSPSLTPQHVCKKLCVAPEKENNNLLAHFICTVNVTLGTGTRPWVWVRVPVRDHGYGYGYEYGYEPMGMGTGIIIIIIYSLFIQEYSINTSYWSPRKP